MHYLPLTNPAVVLGLLTTILAFVFYTASRSEGFWARFYGIVPSLLLCYFLPSLLTTFGLVSEEATKHLYAVARDYLLPASLVLLTLSIDFKGVLRLGPKAVILFLTGTAGIMLGGPLAILIVSAFSPELVGGAGPDAVWRGLTTVAGSWIGGGANQAAMKEVFEVSNDLFSAMIAVDVIVANIWMAVLLFAAGRADKIDAATGADTSAIDDLRRRVAAYQAEVLRIPKLTDTMVVLAVGFGITALAHVLADLLAPALQTLSTEHPGFHWLGDWSLTGRFFWIVVGATTGGLLLSFTSARQLEGVGASRLGSAFLYVLVATIGLKMDIMAVFENTGLFVVGGVWMLIHASLMILVARLIKAPVFFMAVGSQANVGGAASAPIVASAFHPALAPVGVLLAVLGYALGTYGALLCGYMMQAVAPGGVP